MAHLIEIRRPNNDSLVAAYLKIDQEVHNAPHKVQHSFCRMLISEFPDVLVTATQDLSQIVMILTRELHNKIKDTLIEKGLKVLDEYPVSNALFESAFHFTLVNKLAPEWNRVGDYLVQGSDFLKNLSKKKFRAVQLEVHDVSGGMLYFSIKSSLLKLYPLEEWQLGVQRALIDQGRYLRQMKEQRSLSDSVIRCQMRNTRHLFQPHSSRWCKLLPKLSSGQVVGIRLSLKEPGNTSGVESYPELRDYWWNSYGYLLPEEEPPFYYDIYFTGLGTDLFTYPSFCVCSSLPSKVPSDTQSAKDVSIFAFVQLLGRKFSSICGDPFVINLIQPNKPVANLFNTVSANKETQEEEEASPATSIKPPTHVAVQGPSQALFKPSFLAFPQSLVGFQSAAMKSPYFGRKRILAEAQAEPPMHSKKRKP